MIPKKSINPDTETSTSLIYSRHYTFLDSYIYMSNDNYNALYDNNKEILSIEKEAIKHNSASILFKAAYDQTKALHSIVLRVRNFSQLIRQDVMENIKLLMPDDSVLKAVYAYLSTDAPIKPRKMLTYKPEVIEYPNMAIFCALFEKEVKAFTSIVDASMSKSTNPFEKNVATEFLISNAEKYANNNVGILGNEKATVCTKETIVEICDMFKRKSEILGSIRRSFRHFYYYLRQFRLLDKLIDIIKPNTTDDGKIFIGNSTKPLESFSDYLILYKHYSVMVKYMIDIIAYYDAKFFNKIYAIQSNIEMAHAILKSVIRENSIKTSENLITENFNCVGDAVMNATGQIARYNNGFYSSLSSFGHESGSIKDLLPDDDDVIRDRGVPFDIGNEPEELFDKDDTDYDYEYSGYEDDKPYTDEFVEVYKDNKKENYLANSINSFTELSKKESELDSIYDNTKPEDLVTSDKVDIIREASEGVNEVKDVLNGIIENIANNDTKFRESAKEIKLSNSETLDSAKRIDIKNVNLEGVSFDMFNYVKGTEVMHRIRIPSYKADDNDLLLADNAIHYKQKYFRNLFYFSYKNQPINMNKFRGSQAKITLDEPKKIIEAYYFFINYISNYHNIVNSVSNANKRIQSVLTVSSKLVNTSYGTQSPELTEAVILGRTKYGNNIYNMLLEASDGETNVAGATDLNVDDNAVAAADSSKEMYDAMKKYCRITYEVNSTRMQVYEEIYETAFKFLSVVVDAVNNKPTTEENTIQEPTNTQ